MPRNTSKTATATDRHMERLELAYLEAMDEHFASVPLSGLNKAQYRALQRIAARTGAAAETVIMILVREWIQIAGVIKRNSDADWKIPCPSLCAVAKHLEAVLTWLKGAGYMIHDDQPSRKGGRIRERFDPPLTPYDPDEDDDDLVIIGEGASGDEAATA